MAERLTGDYRKFMDKNYLGSWDVPDGEDLILTIDHAARDDVKNERGSERKLTIHFVEDYKPMILNATNSKAITAAHGSSKVEDWAGKKIAIYTTKVTAFGGTTDALRIRTTAPKVVEAICEDCGKTITAHGDYSVNKIVTMSKAKYGASLCWDCSVKRKEAE
jgi:hypothetical protein